VHWNRRTPEELERALTLLSEALRLEPDFVRAHAALADCHLAMANFGIAEPAASYARARAAAARALALDPNSPEALGARGYLRLHADFDWGGASGDLRRALELSPSDTLARQRVAEWLTARGEHAASGSQMDQALRLDPLSAQLHSNAGRLLYLAGQGEAAVNRLQRARDLAPRFVWTQGLLVLAYARLGRPAEALVAAHASEETGQRSTVTTVHALVAAERPSEAREILGVLEARARQGAHLAYHLGAARAVLGDLTQALDWLERAVRERESVVIFLAVDPTLEPVRNEARYRKLLKEIGLGG